MTYRKIRFGEYPSGSNLYFEATNIGARLVPGTLKQIIGKKLVLRNTVARDIWDWDIKVSGIFTGSSEQIEEFKTAINTMWGDEQYYEDGVGSHNGSYLIKNNGFSVDEKPENYNNDVIFFNLDLIEYNQV